MPVIRIGVREAKVNLSRLLREVQKGTKVIITDRGKPVGRLVAIPDEDLSLTDRIKKLERQGVIEPPSKNAGNLPPPLPLDGEQAQRFLQEDRERS